MSQTVVPMMSSHNGKWKRYESYKDSEIDWLGDIPQHWEMKRLKEFVSLLNGYPFDSNLFSRTSGTPLVRIRDLATNSTETFFSGVEVEEALVFNDDILIGMDGDFNECWWQGGRALLNQRLCCIRSQELLNQRFLHYLLPFPLKIINDLTWFTTVKHLSSNQVTGIRFAYPSLSEQKAIATFLDHQTTKIKTLISKKQRLVELLKEERTALISRAVTKGLNLTVETKDSGVEWLGDIPAHWKVRRIKFFAAILRGKFSHRPRNDPRMYNGNYPFIQTGDITAVSRYITEYKQTLNDLGFSVSKQFPSGTLVMAIAANVGDLAILQFPACFPDSIVGFVPVPDVSLEYLYYNLIAMKQELMSTATINTQLNLNIERIGNLLSVHPPLAEQQAIVTYLDRETAKIDALISRIQDGIKKLKEYSTALISAAVTGKIDVRDVEEEPLHGSLREEP